MKMHVSVEIALCVLGVMIGASTTLLLLTVSVVEAGHDHVTVKGTVAHLAVICFMFYLFGPYSGLACTLATVLMIFVVGPDTIINGWGAALIDLGKHVLHSPSLVRLGTRLQTVALSSKD
jgi:hypothetical protein